jgi:hypothetical protein
MQDSTPSMQKRCKGLDPGCAMAAGYPPMY